MKGLYWKQNSSGEETNFVFLEKDNLPVVKDNYVKVRVRACALSRIDTKLLSDIKLEKEFLPVGREVAGVVLEIGNKVSSFQPNDEVVGILPLDSEESGLCEVILIHEHYLAHKPEKISWTEAAATLRDGVRAYTGLHYLSYVSTGKTLLVMNGASPFGTIAIQLAQHRGAKVIATVYSLEDKQYLQRLTPSVARIIDESNGKYDLTESCLEETGGLGVDIILDAGVRSHNKEDKVASQELLPHKHDIITLLSVGGHWVTMEENLQLDPPDSRCLFLKGASVSFLNDEVWNLSNMQQGKYLCILEDIMEKLSSGIFRPLLDEPIPLYEAKVSMEMVQKNQARKKQVVQL
ncbi:quinone oxidoreductase-like protein 1 isoform X2 [Anolis carolinensis]|uniref:Enoyl reductase (ER) domain-containing protein n=2 Tax=Anolis carolinensis TaxID=28377 RepID=G1KD21_ANOCA|nr:PREDICTED: quinone oxidoreductase-like protein 1 isoform X2 [Anolis carolinensis]XP_008105761.1 PREDICTED: quinone oxidoreductase-like protein 1 isoform X2 [Anolis carolinensis]XP_008105762.1 PREDICTED: quinone oxidoreductase-like protein 1 isoform X2 [Anolis carolinensis]XP_008105764.1 PREDICTED: quinone oxidoreductase-like protein 1 isoform X2 [Anolis carolinensis]|eukprot:XP_003219071.1 PREDICTED: quinone oxidoreductase-like protein 1 isoform X2 [Anolis carolinensis]